ncbi:hypothetical protein D9758_014637 [Tetrapyrgos nigripes]|uniref:Uncharacterized protein n=1 Tax=Tetrapyrgos nigripes TaxID=182062 RepID=A0A8H5CUC2_9AGAR|nr:hypothetical protein D9758_014637 [Tetrapyrgos nigripes]
MYPLAGRNHMVSTGGTRTVYRTYGLGREVRTPLAYGPMKRGIDNVTEQNKRKKLILADPDTGPVGRATEKETYLDGQIPQGPRITAGRDVHMNNVQGNQNQTINNDYRQTVNSNNINSIQTGGNNTFVMVDMNARSWQAIRKALKSLPKTLEETYEQALNAVKKEHKEDAQAILKWLLFGHEELTMEMLPEILCIDFEQQTLEDPEPIQGSQLCNIISSTLIVVKVPPCDPEEDILQLGHPSVKEYIVSEEIKESSAKLFQINDQLAHEFIVQCCLIYLVVCGKDGHIKQELFPLAYYAVNRWTEHVRNLQQLGDPVKCLSLHLLTDTNTSCLAWMQLACYSPEAAGSALAFYYASMVNMSNMVLLMMENGADVNAQGRLYGNALQAASFRGEVDIVKLLLENGADVNAQDGLYGTALQAAYEREVDIVMLLLENGADVNAQGGRYGSALQAASYGGEVAIVVKVADTLDGKPPKSHKEEIN